jgi:exodeoxyribonuclease VII large subunit
VATERSASRIHPAVVTRLSRGGGALDAAAASLGALGPAATLERGYAIVRRSADGRIVRDPIDVGAGEGLAIRLARGEVTATVDRPAGTS